MKYFKRIFNLIEAEKIRWFFVILSLVLTLFTIAYTTWSYFNISLKKGIDDVPFNELTNFSIQSRIEMSRSLFQTGLLLTGALFALAITKKGNEAITLPGKREIIMFIMASSTLVLSLISHTLYLQKVSSAFADSGLAFDKNNPSIINIFDPNFNYLFISQVYNLFTGSVIALFTFLSANKLSK